MTVVKTFGVGLLGVGKPGRVGGLLPAGDPQYRIFESETGVLWRKGIRDGYIVLDVALTVTGFAGSENTDWKNVDNTLMA